MSSDKSAPSNARRKRQSAPEGVERRRAANAAAKRAQRNREAAAGLVPCQLTLPAATATRLRMALRQPGFGEALEALLDDWVIDAARFPQLRLLCWNRSSLLLTAREALDLYEANWRFVEPGALEPAEAALVAALAQRLGGGVLNI
jgi:hypothetical protein